MWPSLLTCTLMTSPQRPPFMLLGRVGQPSTRRYGLGSSVGLGYRVCWACALAPNMAIATALATRTNPVRPARDIVTLQKTRIVFLRLDRGCRRFGILRAIMRRLAIRPGGIGDFILSLPALESLRTDYLEIWTAGRNVPLVRFADRVRSIASTGLDLLGVTEPPARLIEELRGFAPTFSWYAASR